MIRANNKCASTRAILKPPTLNVTSPEGGREWWQTEQQGSIYDLPRTCIKHTGLGINPHIQPSFHSHENILVWRSLPFKSVLSQRPFTSSVHRSLMPSFPSKQVPQGYLQAPSSPEGHSLGERYPHTSCQTSSQFTVQTTIPIYIYMYLYIKCWI